MTGEEPRNILKYTMKYADTTYARQCTYMSYALYVQKVYIAMLQNSFVENKRCLSNGVRHD